MYTNPNITYTSEKGRPFRVSGIEKIPDTEKWINKTEKYHWEVLIIFTDELKPNKLKLKYDYNGKHYHTGNY